MNKLICKKKGKECKLYQMGKMRAKSLVQLAKYWKFNLKNIKKYVKDAVQGPLKRYSFCFFNSWSLTKWGSRRGPINMGNLQVY